MPRFIRASEIGTYLYCRKAWHFDRMGMSSGAVKELAAGRVSHKKHLGQMKQIQLFRKLAGILAALAVLSLLFSILQ